MLAHDEVRERSASGQRERIVRESQSHTVALVGLDAHDFSRKLHERILAGQLEIELDRRSWIELTLRGQEGAAARDIFDETVDNEPGHLALRPDADRDSNCFPLVHVVKATLATYVCKINGSYAVSA